MEINQSFSCQFGKYAKKEASLSVIGSPFHGVVFVYAFILSDGDDGDGVLRRFEEHNRVRGRFHLLLQFPALRGKHHVPAVLPVPVLLSDDDQHWLRYAW